MNFPSPPPPAPGSDPHFSRGTEIYRTAFAAGFDCMAISDNGVIVDANDATVRTFGYARAELVGQSLALLVAPESRPAVMGVIAANREAQYEIRFRRKDGSCFDAEALGKPFAVGDRLMRLTVLRDLTERRRSEAALHDHQKKLVLAMQLSRLGLWELDVAAQRFTFDDNFLRVLGTSVEQEGGRSMPADDYARRFIPPEEMELVRHEIASAVATSDPDYRRQLEHAFLRADGSAGVMLVNIAVVKDAAGRTTRTYGINQDITERKQAEEQRSRLEEQLRHAQKMDALGTLAGGIAHDFNNILTGLLGHLQLAQMDLPPGHPALAGLIEAGKAGRRARDLVARILAFGRRHPQDPQPLALGPVVQEALHLLRASLPATIEIRTDLAAELPPVLCDAAQIHQVIMNLGTNAAHAMRDQPGVLSVTLERSAPSPQLRKRHPQVHSGHLVRLVVQDTGVGIDDTVLPRIFEPFFTTKPTGEGTGLGLTMVYNIMQNHQGAIVVESTPGIGTSFHLYFPPAAPARGAAGDHAATPELLRAFGRGRRIMLVDDDAAVRQVGERMLVRLGFVPAVFSDPRTALQDYRQFAGLYCAVLSDLTMPGMTGVEFAAELAHIRPDAPLLLASGYVHKLVEPAAWTSGVRRIIHKPFQFEDLAAQLRAVLGEPVG